MWFNSDYDENCYIPIDWGMKYDLWRVDGEDEQADIDEFEERELLHQGTADELLPYIQRMRGSVKIDGLAGYDPTQDELLVRLPIVGGGRITDKDILEVTVYSDKYRTILGEGPGAGLRRDRHSDRERAADLHPLELLVRLPEPAADHLHAGRGRPGQEQRQQVRRAAVHR